MNKKQDILATLNQTLNMCTTARNHNISTQRVQQVAKSYGITKSVLKNKKTEKYGKIIQAEFESGKTLKQIGLEFKLNPNSVRRYLIDYSGKTPKQFRSNKSTRLQLHKPSGIYYIYNYSTKRCTTRARWIMEQKLGRRLESSEIVIHSNGNSADDSLDNLRVASKKEAGSLWFSKKWKETRKKRSAI